jgi:hypothetical protein
MLRAYHLVADPSAGDKVEGAQLAMMSGGDDVELARAGAVEIEFLQVVRPERDPLQRILPHQADDRPGRPGLA